ncbi:hypothetical protein ACJU26_04995 [Acidithiobacillus sp. M4-SHS-6]|uniref:hypothetical protein n=1 Tax=Acidithiobacillus sp. M4-SHS-6 TaxID=3383024 RepID=UPI0039BEA3DE
MSIQNCYQTDNNLTRKVSLTDSSWIAANKGWVAGSVNLLLAHWLGSAFPLLPDAMAAMILGFLPTGSVWPCLYSGCAIWAAPAPGPIFPARPFWARCSASFLVPPSRPCYWLRRH